ncbi:unnamed protein product [Auanema sp. JU1783]|nr:unnamed protein product [Auanema sp. JU1783]
MLLRIFLSFTLLATVSSRTPTKLRSLWNFERITECVLHHTALVYNNYGCWCGVGGSNEPVDGIDDCCMHHDKCYDRAVDSKICFDVPWEYVDNYNWKCMNSTAVCDNEQTGCAAALCACDTEVVRCWSKFPKPTTKPSCNRSRHNPRTKFFEPQ